MVTLTAEMVTPTAKVATPAAEPLSRPFNFSPGPAALPEEVLQQVREELPDWRGGGVSVMERGHREDDFRRCAHEAEADLRALMEIPDDYHVLFLHGGAQLQFAAVPMNLAAGQSLTADYVNSGHWAALAMAEARRYLTVNECATVVDDGAVAMPEEGAWRRSGGGGYLHYTPNETISGLEFHRVPEAGAGPLVADMSSVILSRRFAVRRFGLIYASAQKNIGPAGLAVVIVRRDLAERAAGAGTVPRVMNYAAQAAAGSMVNTPPVFAWYVAGLVLRWLRDNGGVAAMEKQNAEKAAALYNCIDNSGGFYRNRVAAEWRSRMNITFTLAAPQLGETFLAEAAAAGLTGLRGHRAAGGLRASLYNAVPPAGVRQLTQFMNHFRQTRG